MFTIFWGDYNDKICLLVLNKYYHYVKSFCFRSQQTLVSGEIEANVWSGETLLLENKYLFSMVQDPMLTCWCTMDSFIHRTNTTVLEFVQACLGPTHQSMLEVLYFSAWTSRWQLTFHYSVVHNQQKANCQLSFVFLI